MIESNQISRSGRTRHEQLRHFNEAVITSYAQAPARTVTAGGVTYAYRELGPKGGIPVVFFVHLAATLDNWDPRIVDPIAQHRHVIAFDNRGVGASTGQVPDTVEGWPTTPTTSSRRWARQDRRLLLLDGRHDRPGLIVKHPDLVRRLVLTGTGPQGRQGHGQGRPHDVLGHPPRRP